MGDVADMLGLSQGQKPTGQSTIAEEALKIMNNSKSKVQKLAKKPKGMKREVYDLLGEDGLLPAVQANPVAAPMFKNKRVVTKGRWVWAPIENSARVDHSKHFHHWVKAEIQYTDYPYARYNLRVEKIQYTDEEYELLLKDDSWTREDTETFLDICHQYDLRWPVIFDRIQLSTQHSDEDMMARYYFISTTLLNLDRSVPLAAPEKKVQIEYDMDKESRRRKQHDILFRRTKEDEQEELRIKEEIKNIDAILKKNKKVVKNSDKDKEKEKEKQAAAAAAAAAAVAATQVAGPSTEVKVKDENGQVAVVADGIAVTTFSISNPSQETYVGPEANKPCLQSSRLYLTDGNLNIAKSLIGKMNSYLKEINIPERPVPTRRVCDLVDQIRKNTVSLISVHNAIKKKEKELQAVKSGSSKGGNKATTKKEKKDDPNKEKPEKVPKPKAPPKGKKAAATTETQSDPSNANADKLKSQSIDATTLRVKEEMINELFLDESFLDEPLDSLAGFEPKLPAKRGSNALNDGEGKPAKGGNKDKDKDGNAQPKKRAKKAQT